MLTMRTVLNADEIRNMLLHSPPFLMLDRVTELTPNKCATGLKNVTIDEPFFAGHFPKKAIMPGVLIVEVLAQLTAIIFYSAVEPGDAEAEREGYVVMIKNMKFLKLVTPGDQLILRATVIDGNATFAHVKVSAHVGHQLVAEGILGVAAGEPVKEAGVNEPGETDASLN